MSLRVGVFVNVANQFSALAMRKKSCRVNYDRYLKSILDDRDRLITAVAYGTQLVDEASNFIYFLRKVGFLTKFVSSVKAGQAIIQPSRNVEMTIDIMHMVEKLDAVVIGSNDPELIPLVQFLQLRGIQVSVITPTPFNSDAVKTIDILADETLVESIHSMRDKRQ